MKTSHRFIAMLLAGVLFLSCVPAYAMTTSEKEKNYSDALLALETYLESSGNSSADLAGIENAFRELGGYEQSRFLRYYVSVLMKIADEEFDFQLNTYLDMLEADGDFQKYLENSLEGSSIKSVDKLKAYTTARMYEHEGRIAEAMEEYKKCLSFFGADERYRSLIGTQYEDSYERAMELLQDGDYAAAYCQFAELLGYSDSKQIMDSIVRQVGYTPSSPTDNLEAAAGLKAAEIKNTEITLSWQKSRHASGYTVYYRQNGSRDWIAAGTVSETKKQITGLKEGEVYDFRVIAVSGQVKAKEALLTGVKMAKVTPTPSPSKGTAQTSTPQPTLTLSVTSSVGVNTLTWNSISGATSYTIQRHMTKTSYTDLVTSKQTTYKDNDVKGGYKYYYTVTAHFSNGKTIKSNEAITVATTETPAHTHSWKEADCTHPKTCTTCGATQGNALGHNWKAATCTAPQTCSRCGATQGSALGHNWQPATEYAPKTCSRCGATEGSKISWSPWSAWSTTPVTASATREVNTKTVSEPVYTTKYHYSRWRYWRTDLNNWGVSYAEYRGAVYGGSGTWQYKTTDSPLAVIEYVDGRKVYTGYWYNETTEKVQSGTNNVVYYQYRDRIQ